MGTASGPEPLAVRFCITRCQCGLSQQLPSLCRGHPHPGPSAGPGQPTQG